MNREPKLWIGAVVLTVVLAVVGTGVPGWRWPRWLTVT